MLARLLVLSLVMLALATVIVMAPAADAPPAASLKDELPRIPPHEPADALQTFRVQPGFRLEQVAAEPLVADPVAMAFDENGRLYVVEMCDYSEQDKELLGKVRLLEDVNGDGRFDKATEFVDKLSWPTAITCYDGGVFIGAAPDIVYCKDTNGDGKADVRRVAFTGFGRSNVQGLLNSLTWTLDNRIAGATSSSGGEIRPGGNPKAAPIVIRGRDFSFDPRTLDFAPASGGGQYGMSFDDWGHKFVCSNSDHLQQVMFEDRYLARNPYVSAPSPRVSIAADGPQAEIYRASPVEPWRIVRTRLRIAGTVPGAVEQGGRVSGYFTGASGLQIFRGDGLGLDMLNTAIVGEACGGLVHRKTLTRQQDGLQFVGRRIDDKSEWVASSDIWFRPVQFFNAPDGALYIADMYREVIEHPASLPPIIKQHLDLTSGRDRGRIYRVVADGFKHRPLPKLGSASTAELVTTLEHPNAWHRETAARLLFERQDRSAIALLEKLAAESRSPLGRMHALYALDGLHALSAAAISTALEDNSPRVRQHAVRLAERVTKDRESLMPKLAASATDDDLEVRFQLAFTLGEFPGEPATKALGQLARSGAEDRWIRLAIQTSLGTQAGSMLEQLAADAAWRTTAGGKTLLTALASQIGMQARSEDQAVLFRTVEQLPASDDALAAALVAAMSEGAQRSGKPIQLSSAASGSGKAIRLLQSRLTSAHRTAGDESKTPKQRAAAIGMLALGKFADEKSLLADALTSRQPQEVQQAALATLARFSDPAVADLLIEAWPGLSPSARQAAADALFARPERVKALLAAVADKRMSAADLDPARLKLLATHRDPAIRERAAELMKGWQLGRRQDVVDAYRSTLELKGDPARGKIVFTKICAACHKAEGVGHETGPSLATVKNRGAEFILLNVLDPSREVNPQFVNYVVITDDGRSLTGMIAAETATSVTLRRGEGASDTVLRINIEQMQSTGLSLMPEGLEKQLDQQSLADVIAYVLALP